MLKQVNEIKCGKIFIFNGKKYKFIESSGNWKILTDETGFPISPTDIPTELLIGTVKVEVEDEI